MQQKTIVWFRCADMASVQDSAPPSAAAIAIGTAIVSVVVGYYVGQAQSIGVFGGSPRPHRAALADDEESDASDADSQSGGVHEVGELKHFAGSGEECKLVLVTRTDLGMGKGKCQHPPISVTHPPLLSAPNTRARPCSKRRPVHPTRTRACFCDSSAG